MGNERKKEIKPILTLKSLEEKINEIAFKQDTDRLVIRKKFTAMMWVLAAGFVLFGILFFFIYMWNYLNYANLLALIARITIALNKAGIAI